jgi:uncharacterized membrane-anchored protein
VTPNQRVEAARIAEGFRTDPVIQEAREAAKAELVKKWLESPTFDENQARVVWASAKAIDVLDEQVRRIIQDGKFAAEGLKK